MPLVLEVADLHVGSSLGLFPPGLQKAEGKDVWALNPFQEWLWECWQTGLGEMQTRAKAWHRAHKGDKVWGVVLGDVIQGAHAKDGQVVSSRLDVQVRGAYEALKPFRKLVDELYILHGTAWHGGKVSEHVGTLAGWLEAKPEPTTGEPCWWELYLDVGGHLVHHTHHVAMTNLPFYEATAPLRDYYVLAAESTRSWGAEAPQVEMTVTAHRHRAILVHKPPHIQVMCLPCWQLRGEFAFKVAARSLPDIGYAEVWAQDGMLLARQRVFPLPKPHIEAA